MSQPQDESRQADDRTPDAAAEPVDGTGTEATDDDVEGHVYTGALGDKDRP